MASSNPMRKISFGRPGPQPIRVDHPNLVQRRRKAGTIALCLALALTCAGAYPTGYIGYGCPPQIASGVVPGHGVVASSGTGGLSLRVRDGLSGLAVAAYDPAAVVPYYVDIVATTTNFKGFILGAFASSASSTFTSPMVGALHTNSVVNVASMGNCPGLTHSLNLLKPSVVGMGWTAPSSSVGAVTFWAVVVTGTWPSTIAYQIQLALPVVASPTASPSGSTPPSPPGTPPSTPATSPSSSVSPSSPATPASTPTITGSAALTGSSTGSQSRTGSGSPTPSGRTAISTASPSSSATRTASSPSTPTPSLSVGASESATATLTPVPSISLSASLPPSVSGTVASSQSVVASPSRTPSPSLTGTGSGSASPAPTQSPSPSGSVSRAQSSTGTGDATPSPRSSPTRTRSPPSTSSPTGSASASSSASPTMASGGEASGFATGDPLWPSAAPLYGALAQQTAGPVAQLYWAVDSVTLSVRFRLVGLAGRTWLGLGVSPLGAMLYAPGDDGSGPVVLGVPPDSGTGAGTVGQLRLGSQVDASGEVAVSAAQVSIRDASVFTLSGGTTANTAYTDENTTLEFTRALSTSSSGDAGEKAIDPHALTTFIWAVGASTAVGAHGPNSRGAVRLRLQGTTCSRRGACGGRGDCFMVDGGPACACDVGYIGSACGACAFGFVVVAGDAAAELLCSFNASSDAVGVVGFAMPAGALSGGGANSSLLLDISTLLGVPLGRLALLSSSAPSSSSDANGLVQVLLALLPTWSEVTPASGAPDPPTVAELAQMLRSALATLANITGGGSAATAAALLGVPPTSPLRNVTLLGAATNGVPATLAVTFVPSLHAARALVPPRGPFPFFARLSPVLALRWRVGNGAVECALTFSGVPGAWFGLGVNPVWGAQMAGADAVVVQPARDSGARDAGVASTASVSQFVLGGQSAGTQVPASGGGGGLASVYGTSYAYDAGFSSGTSAATTASGSSVTVTFIRPFAAGAYAGAQALPSEPGALTPLVFAWGASSDGTIAQHALGDSGSGSIGWSSGVWMPSTPDVSVLRGLHIVFAIAGTALLVFGLVESARRAQFAMATDAATAAAGAATVAGAGVQGGVKGRGRDQLNTPAAAADANYYHVRALLHASDVLYGSMWWFLASAVLMSASCCSGIALSLILQRSALSAHALLGFVATVLTLALPLLTWYGMHKLTLLAAAAVAAGGTATVDAGGAAAAIRSPGEFSSAAASAENSAPSSPSAASPASTRESPPNRSGGIHIHTKEGVLPLSSSLNTPLRASLLLGLLAGALHVAAGVVGAIGNTAALTAFLLVALALPVCASHCCCGHAATMPPPRARPRPAAISPLSVRNVRNNPLYSTSTLPPPRAPTSALLTAGVPEGSMMWRGVTPLSHGDGTRTVSSGGGVGGGDDSSSSWVSPPQSSHALLHAHSRSGNELNHFADTSSGAASAAARRDAGDSTRTGAAAGSSSSGTGSHRPTLSPSAALVLSFASNKKQRFEAVATSAT